MNKEPSCILNGHAYYASGLCIYCGNGKVDGKSQEWRDAADRLIEALARENQYLVSDMVIIFLESAGYGLPDYSPLGGAFKRAAKKGLIARVDRPTKQALWVSKLYKRNGV